MKKWAWDIAANVPRSAIKWQLPPKSNWKFLTKNNSNGFIQAYWCTHGDDSKSPRECQFRKGKFFLSLGRFICVLYSILGVPKNMFGRSVGIR